MGCGASSTASSSRVGPTVVVGQRPNPTTHDDTDKTTPGSAPTTAPNTARNESVQLIEADEHETTHINTTTTKTTTTTSGEASSRNRGNSQQSEISATSKDRKDTSTTTPTRPPLEPAVSLQGLSSSKNGKSSEMVSVAPPTSAALASRPPSSHDPRAKSSPPSRQSNDSDTFLPIMKSKTFNRRSSFGGGSSQDEYAWRTPKIAQDLIQQHLAEDPHCFRDHVAIYWRIENVPTPNKSETSLPTQPVSKMIAPQPLHPSPSADPLHHSSTPSMSPASSPLYEPNRTNAKSVPIFSHTNVPDQVFVYLSLGPSSGGGDKIAGSELRTSEPSISYYPMLLPYHSLNGGDPNFSIQVQVWQKRVTTVNGGHISSLTLLGYLDASVQNLFASHDKKQGLLLKSPPSSVMNGQPVIPLSGTMLVVDYIQFYCHTTPAVTANPSRWPAALCTPAADCLWRGQIHAIKLGVPRGCPHPNIGGSMSPANGGLSLNFKDLGGPNVGVCFVQIFRQENTAATNPKLSVTSASPSLTVTSSPTTDSVTDRSHSTSAWKLVHTSEFLPLTRNPKFSEFQRPLADICQGAYDRPLLLQVVLSHDSIRPCELNRSMPADTICVDPASVVTAAVKTQNLGICGISHTISCMRELLAGKTKLKLHAPGMIPSLAEDMHGLTGLLRSTTFNFEVPPISLSDEIGTVPSAQSSQPSTTADRAIALGTLAFNISQIFSSRASLETLARAKLAEFERSSHMPVNDGFNELGIVRSTAFLASMLPLTGRKHRPSVHLRGPSALIGFTSNDHDHHQSHTHHGRQGSLLVNMPIQRSKTMSNMGLFGHNSSSSSSSSTSGVSTLLEKMGIAQDSPSNNSNAKGQQQSQPGLSRTSSKRRSM